MFTFELPRRARVLAHSHENTTEGRYVLEGTLRVWLDDGEHVIGQGDYASIPPGVVHRSEGAAFFTKAIAISTPGGLEELPGRVGEPTELHMCAEDAAPLSSEALGAAAGGVDLSVA